MTLENLEAFLADSNNDGDPDGFEASIDALRNDTGFIRVIVIEASTEEVEWKATVMPIRLQWR